MASLQFFIVLVLSSAVFGAGIFTKIGLGTGEDLRSPKERANWGSVRDHFAELNLFTFSTYSEITDAVYTDENGEVYEEIYEVLYESFQSAYELSQLVSDEITNQSLTVEVAKFHLGEMLVIITDLYGTVEMELKKLSQEGQDQAIGAFTGYFLNATMYADKIYSALEEPNPGRCGLVGYPENQTLITLDPVDAWTPPGTTILLVDSFSVAEIYLMMHAHNKYLDQQMPGRILTLITSSEFPNFVDETGALNISRTVMFRCNDESTITYTFQIPINSDPIEEPTVKPKV